jgi:hypothetical protein
MRRRLAAVARWTAAVLAAVAVIAVVLLLGVQAEATFGAAPGHPQPDPRPGTVAVGHG